MLAFTWVTIKSYKLYRETIKGIGKRSHITFQNLLDNQYLIEHPCFKLKFRLNPIV